MSETHIIKLPKRTGKVEVVEEPKRILIKLRFDKYGAFGDDAEFINWLRPIFEKYDTDTRPLVIDNPTTGEVATVFGDATYGMAFVEKLPA